MLIFHSVPVLLIWPFRNFQSYLNCLLVGKICPYYSFNVYSLHRVSSFRSCLCNFCLPSFFPE